MSAALGSDNNVAPQWIVTKAATLGPAQSAPVCSDSRHWRTYELWYGDRSWNAEMSWAGFNDTLARDAVHSLLASAVVVSFDDPEKLTPEDRIMVLGMWRTLFHVWSNGHRQWTNETLDHVLYESIISEISTYGHSRDRIIHHAFMDE